jgi:hypothetical protein
MNPVKLGHQGTSITVEIPEEMATRWNRLPKETQERLLHERLLSGLPEISPLRSEQLLLRISEGLPIAFWERLGFLRRKAEESALTPEEYQERLDLITKQDQSHLQRMEYVLELAHLRKQNPHTTLKELGISPLISH